MQNGSSKKVKGQGGAKVATKGNGRRFTDEQRQHALLLVASGVSASEVARIMGTTDKTVRVWERTAQSTGAMPSVPTALEVAAKSGDGESGIVPAEVEQAGDAESAGSEPSEKAEDAGTTVAVQAVSKSSIYAPKDPGQGLSEVEVAAILELKREHPSYGPAQLRAQLKRFKGWRLSNKAIARTLRAHGYELVHRGSKPQGFEPTHFEAPRRNALWQMDFTDLRVGGEKLSLLVALDDFSRYVVGHKLASSPEANVAVEVVASAMARHGKPEAIRTDRGGAFMGKEFTDMLDAELIDHVVGRAYHPQGGGKVESAIGTVKRELWEVEHFEGRVVAERRLSEFFVEYNERRAHMGIDGLTPADRYFGRADQVLARIDAASRRRQGARALERESSDVTDEFISSTHGAPLEVLRLVVAQGHMQLRFCGHVVDLGQLRS